MSSSQGQISRVIRSREQARATYDRISRLYDPLEGYWEREPKALALRMLGMTAGQVALEIGFGTGHGIEALAQAVGPAGKVYGLDLSPKMLELTTKRMNKRGLGDRIDLRTGDAVRLAFADGFFDGIFMSFVLELFDTPEIPRVLGECKRVLKAGGRIGVVSLSKLGGRNRMRDLYESGHDKFPSLLDCRPIFVQRSLEEVGFSTQDSELVTIWGLPVEILVSSKPA